MAREKRPGATASWASQLGFRAYMQVERMHRVSVAVQVRACFKLTPLQHPTDASPGKGVTAPQRHTHATPPACPRPPTWMSSNEAIWLPPQSRMRSRVLAARSAGSARSWLWFSRSSCSAVQLLQARVRTGGGGGQRSRDGVVMPGAEKCSSKDQFWRAAWNEHGAAVRHAAALQSPPLT